MPEEFPLEKILDYSCFPESFSEGRAWFRRAVDETGGVRESATLPGHAGFDGETLTTDVAWFGDRRAERVFFSTCGTHGQEYFCGAAGQLHWMLTGGVKRLPTGMAVCLLHAHNPFGASHLSRGNEHFVDLNRNYFDFDQPVRPNPLYAQLFDILFTEEMNEHVLDDAMAGFYTFLEENDTQAVLTAMGGGQNTHPTGTIYCGEKPEWSTENLRSVVREYLSQAGRVAVIDWHTGLGEPSRASATERPAEGSPEYSFAQTAWNIEEPDESMEGSDAPDFVGQVWDGVARDIEGLGGTAVSTVIEIGTVDNQSVLAALLIDRWLRVVCQDPRSPFACEYRTKMLERLNPSRTGWRTASVTSMSTVYKNTLSALAAWS